MRALIIVVVMLGLGAHRDARANDAFGPVPRAPASHSFKVGTLQLMSLRDAQIVLHNDGKTFGVDAGPAAVGELLKANGLPDDRITLGLAALLVRTGHRVILLDCGLGPKARGNLLASLRAAGVSPEAVTDVAITHTHGDHAGGLNDAAGGLAFPKATIWMAAAEWAWIKGPPIAPGVTPIALDGHTPGHVGYEIVSSKMRLLDISDLAHSSLVSLAKPEWTMGFDRDAVLAKATRKATLARLARDQELVFAPHFPFPGVGRVAVDGEGYAWRPATP